MRLEPGGVLRRLPAAIAVGLAVTLLLVLASSCGSLTIGQKALRPAPVGVRLATPTALPHENTVPMHEDCTACHIKDNQLVKGKPMPEIPHQVAGWEQCSFCHADGRLSPMPARHAGATDDQCQTCHKTQASPPPLMAHLVFEDKQCTSCHGPVVALPVTHADRPGYTCDLCHQTPPSAPPAAPHPATDGQKCGSCHTAVLAPHTLKPGESCATCHTGKTALALPPSHAGRTEPLCTLCHQEQKAAPPAIPHDIQNRGRCTDCHAEGNGSLTPGARQLVQ